MRNRRAITKPYAQQKLKARTGGKKGRHQSPLLVPKLESRGVRKKKEKCQCGKLISYANSVGAGHNKASLCLVQRTRRFKIDALGLIRLMVIYCSYNIVLEGYCSPCRLGKACCEACPSRLVASGGGHFSRCKAGLTLKE